MSVSLDLALWVEQAERAGEVTLSAFQMLSIVAALRAAMECRSMSETLDKALGSFYDIPLEFIPEGFFKECGQ